MKRTAYVFLVLMPNIAYCKTLGITAMCMEKVGSKLRLHCLKRITRVMDKVPEGGNGA